MDPRPYHFEYRKPRFSNPTQYFLFYLVIPIIYIKVSIILEHTEHLETCRKYKTYLHISFPIPLKITRDLHKLNSSLIEGCEKLTQKLTSISLPNTKISLTNIKIITIKNQIIINSHRVIISNHRNYREAIAMMLFIRTPNAKIISMSECHMIGYPRNNPMIIIEIIVMIIDRKLVNNEVILKRSQHLTNHTTNSLDTCQIMEID